MLIDGLGRIPTPSEREAQAEQFRLAQEAAGPCENLFVVGSPGWHRRQRECGALVTAELYPAPETKSERIFRGGRESEEREALKTAEQARRDKLMLRRRSAGMLARKGGSGVWIGAGIAALIGIVLVRRRRRT